MDNLSSHKGPKVREMIEAAGASLLFLPPYSPDFNPIEIAFFRIPASSTTSATLFWLRQATNSRYRSNSPRSISRLPRREAFGRAEALIASSFELLNTELGREIVERVHSFSPAFFERLIVDLLVRMGYGGGRAEMGRALGRVGDGGVDGVIKEDELGLDVVYVQAKRLDPDTGVPLREVRDFVGGLEGHRASKGVL